MMIPCLPFQYVASMYEIWIKRLDQWLDRREREIEKMTYNYTISQEKLDFVTYIQPLYGRNSRKWPVKMPSRNLPNRTAEGGGVDGARFPVPCSPLCLAELWALFAHPIGRCEFEPGGFLGPFAFSG
jgi:hypothetical protein